MDEVAGLSGFEIAIIGMACRFPGADNLDQFWLMLKNGVEAVSSFSEGELLREGVPEALARHPDYVPMRGVLEDAEMFDAPFFGYYPREAQMLDPQQRIFLECVWEALEDAACVPGEATGPIGLFAGPGINNYALYAAADPEVAASAEPFQVQLASSPHLLTTRASYKLNLSGPSLAVMTACSTSLVAVHLACQSLWQGESSVALAGGVRVAFPQRTGHLYVRGGALSDDGHCRAFDADAKGTFSSDGVGVVALKRLEDALAHGDRIRAVIKGSAINNDGNDKIGLTAPSVKGQCNVIRAALLVAGVEPQTIGYVEAHGTGTPLGDPIEVAALTQAYGAHTGRKGSCALGSVKTNIGHTDTAAGVAGLIKAALALEHGAIPPSLHFRRPNPEIDFDDGPFYVNTTARSWAPGPHPRRAAVSSFGIGGTNAHVILEEPPPPRATSPSPRWHLLTLSARTPAALEAATRNLERRLERGHAESLADIAYTLHTGRAAFAHRRAVVCHNAADAVAHLQTGEPEVVRSGVAVIASPPPIAFLFPGGGTQYVGMGAGLYEAVPTYRRALDECAQLLLPRLGLDIREALYPRPAEGAAPPDGQLGLPAVMLSSVFAVSYALAQLWMSWGVKCDAMLGHSLGEYVAACLSGVLTLEDALRLVVRRGELFARLPAGAMLAVSLPEEELERVLPRRLSVAAVNNPVSCVVSGAPADVEEFERRLVAEDVWCRRLNISVAGHSAAVEPILAEFSFEVKRVELRPPQTPYISCVTGDWVTREQATDPDYWVTHLRKTVRFGDGIGRLLKDERRVLLEAGPGHVLSSLARASEHWRASHLSAASLRHPEEPVEDEEFLLSAVAQLWVSGVRVDWQRFHEVQTRNLTGLPTYPFERRRYTVRPRAVAPAAAGAAAAPAETHEPAARDADAPTPVRAGADSGPPLKATERRLAKMWENLFGIAPIGAHHNFFELGGHSLLATRLVFLLQKEWGIKLSLRSLYEAPTVARLARIIDGGARPAPPSEPSAELEELLADAALPSDIVIEAARAAQRDDDSAGGDARAVLLTGATGYLGGHLLAELVRQTQMTIFCLVRARSEVEALGRIGENLAAYGLWEEGMTARITPVLGDLKSPLLNLDEEKFAELARAVGAVYHCGAEVHFTHPYSVLKAANVTGTRELIRLACRGRRKVLHHISTLAVFSTPHYLNSEVGEEAETGPAQSLTTGYAQSKWVAERAVATAREAGVKAVIYRAGAVLGDTRSAVSRPGDALWRVLKASIQIGKVPEGDWGIAAAPADYVSGAIVRLSLAEDCAGKTFHVIGPEPLRWADLFESARAEGFELKSVPYADWYGELLERARDSDDGALYPLIHLYESQRLATPTFRCAATRQALDGWASPHAEVGRELLRRYISHFIRSGFLDTPPSPATG